MKEEFLYKNGVLEALIILRNKMIKTIKKFNQNPIKLRFLRK
ncbi:hypothetical protein [Borreliella valaisiana]|uniref:Putative plasmid partition protein n=2 Tax=Borreliella TaxID=64895 RepID=C0R8L1_BORVA|nr:MULTISPECIES: hypothetical protein [Borreliella]ACN52786.1 putative plasmid partition protein [Borreliella valaisiana VS116]WLN25920.1 hypothetical protein KJD10_05890 [Borreliella valaisiana]WVN14702.1 hypothetical protein KJD09_05100 [Borreliella valaisiana]